MLRKIFIATAFFLAITLAINSLSYLNFNPAYGFLRLKQEAVATGWYLPFYYSHVLLAGIVLVIGLIQLSTSWSINWKPAHRILGKIYVYGILLFAAPGGLVMSFFIDRGEWVFTSFILQSLLWFVFTILAIKNAQNGNLIQHAEWMWRSYALTFAAVTLRLYAFATSWTLDLNNSRSYAVITWLSWTVNLLIVEFYIHSKRPALNKTITNSSTNTK